MGRPAPTSALLRRRRDQRGGAISLWVVLMVPVAAFAAVVAMAGPQRMAAESSMEEAAGDLATLAVILRDGRTDPNNPLVSQQEGAIEGFLPDCPQIAIPVSQVDPKYADYEAQRDGLEAVCNLLLGDDATPGSVEGYLRRDLGYLGINTNSWEGFYSDSIVPGGCKISDTRQTKDAVYVALAGDWEDGGWAAAQAWPDGVRLGDELVARLNLRNSDTTLTGCVADQLIPPPSNDPPRTVISD